MPLFHKLGCKPRRIDTRTLRFAKYLVASALPPAPASCDWTTKAAPDWGMMVNDQIGDCTIASAGHAIQTWSAQNGSEVTLDDSAIVAAYSAVSGYDPTTGANDNGAVELDVLNYWRNTGIGGRKLGAYAAVMPSSASEVKEAIWLMGGVYMGVALPAAVQGRPRWLIPNSHWQRRLPQWQPGSWGGHAVFCNAYNANWIQCITWGKKLLISWGFWNAYVQEAYALLSSEWVNDTTFKLAPSGFDLATLQSDLGALPSLAA